MPNCRWLPVQLCRVPGIFETSHRWNRLCRSSLDRMLTDVILVFSTKLFICKVQRVRPGPKRLIVLTTNKQSKQCLSSVAGPEQTTNKQQNNIHLQRWYLSNPTYSTFLHKIYNLLICWADIVQVGFKVWFQVNYFVLLVLTDSAIQRSFYCIFMKILHLLSGERLYTCVCIRVITKLRLTY